MVTYPPERAESIAQTLLEKRGAACVNISNVFSLYWWENTINSDKEVLLLIKTRVDTLTSLENSVKEVHPYDVPEMIVLPISTDSQNYLDWISARAKETTS